MAIKSPSSRIAPVGPMYRITMQSGSLTAVSGYNTGTLGSAVFSMQWANPYAFMHITHVNVQWSLDTTFTTQQALPFGLFKVYSYTVAPTGGTAATLTAATSTTAVVNMALDQKQNNYGSAFGDSYFVTAGDIRMATTGALTAGTGSIDKYPLSLWGIGSQGNLAGNGAVYNNPIDFGRAPNTTSLAVGYQEGITIQPLATMGAAGKINLWVSVEWIEVPNSLR